MLPSIRFQKLLPIGTSEMMSASFRVVTGPAPSDRATSPAPPDPRTP